jgi:hypothetical protein
MLSTTIHRGMHSPVMGRGVFIAHNGQRRSLPRSSVKSEDRWEICNHSLCNSVLPLLMWYQIRLVQNNVHASRISHLTDCSLCNHVLRLGLQRHCTASHAICCCQHCLQWSWGRMREDNWTTSEHYCHLILDSHCSQGQQNPNKGLHWPKIAFVWRFTGCPRWLVALRTQDALGHLWDVSGIASC